jgi:hypothetical protein
MHVRDRPAQRRPAAFVDGQGDRFFIVGDEVRAQDGSYARGFGGALELDRAVDAVGVGAGQCREPPLGGRAGERLGTRDPDAEGEMGVEVEVDHGGTGSGFGICSVFPIRMYPRSGERQGDEARRDRRHARETRDLGTNASSPGRCIDRQPERRQSLGLDDPTIHGPCSGPVYTPRHEAG